MKPASDQNSLFHSWIFTISYTLRRPGYKLSWFLALAFAVIFKSQKCLATRYWNSHLQQHVFIMAVSTALCQPLCSWHSSCCTRHRCDQLLHTEVLSLPRKWRSWWAFFIIASTCWADDRFSEICMSNKLKLFTLCTIDQSIFSV